MLKKVLKSKNEHFLSVIPSGSVTVTNDALDPVTLVTVLLFLTFGLHSHSLEKKGGAQSPKLN